MAHVVVGSNFTYDSVHCLATDNPIIQSQNLCFIWILRAHAKIKIAVFKIKICIWANAHLKQTRTYILFGFQNFKFTTTNQLMFSLFLVY